MTKKNQPQPEKVNRVPGGKPLCELLDDTGVRVVTKTGAQRERAPGKGRYDLIPGYPHERLAQHFENGARKYEPRNWERGLPLSWYIDAIERHLTKFKMGCRTEDHLAAIAWNTYCYIETERRTQAGTLPLELADVPWGPSVP